MWFCRNYFNMWSLFQSNWLAEQTINNLVIMAIPVFIVAATVWRFVADP
jgi:hypothetical protein